MIMRTKAMIITMKTFVISKAASSDSEQQTFPIVYKDFDEYSCVVRLFGERGTGYIRPS
jgi:hypothetical protein